MTAEYTRKPVCIVLSQSMDRSVRSQRLPSESSSHWNVAKMAAPLAIISLVVGFFMATVFVWDLEVTSPGGKGICLKTARIPDAELLLRSSSYTVFTGLPLPVALPSEFANTDTAKRLAKTPQCTYTLENMQFSRLFQAS